MQRRSTVLFVSDDLGLSDEVGAWLEEPGLDVLLCPGPGRGGCIGLSGRQCALERAADAVVLDLHPTGDSFVDASRRPELARHIRFPLTLCSCQRTTLVNRSSLARSAPPPSAGLPTDRRLPRRCRISWRSAVGPASTWRRPEVAIEPALASPQSHGWPREPNSLRRDRVTSAGLGALGARDLWPYSPLNNPTNLKQTNLIRRTPISRPESTDEHPLQSG
jgi:hypothetical protein